MIEFIESTIIGAAFYALPIGHEAKISFDIDELIVSCNPDLEERIHYAEVLEFNICGPGKNVSGGGFVGGGYGIEGALLGMATSAILNASTTKSTIQTFISVVTIKGEIHLFCKSYEPYALRVYLSRIYSILRHLDVKKVRSHFSDLELLVKNNLISQDRVDKIQSGFLNRRQFLPVHGYLVSSISHGLVAYKAGMLVNDLLIKYNSIEIKSDGDLSEAIKNSVNNNNLLIVRNGVLISLICDPGRLGIDGRIV